MFGFLGKALAALAADLPPTPAPMYPYGRAPRKFMVSGPPAEYPEGPEGDKARQRAIRRFERWTAANPNKKPPTHIWHNMATATNQGAVA